MIKVVCSHCHKEMREHWLVKRQPLYHICKPMWGYFAGMPILTPRQVFELIRIKEGGVIYPANVKLLPTRWSQVLCNRCYKRYKKKGLIDNTSPHPNCRCVMVPVIEE